MQYNQEELQEEGEEGEISSQQEERQETEEEKNGKRDISNVRCYTCDEKGHLERDCPIKKSRHHANIG